MSRKRKNRMLKKQLRTALEQNGQMIKQDDGKKRVDEKKSAGSMQRRKMTDGTELERLCVRAEQAAAEKQKRRRIGFSSFLGRQVRFIGWRIWFMQGIGTIALYSMCQIFFQGMLVKYIQNIAFFLCCLAVLVLISTVPIVYRSIRYAMYETELATRFSAVRLLAARLLAIGLGNFAVLGGILLLAAMKASVPAAQAFLYLLLPYLVASGGFLYLLKRVPAESSQLCSIAWGCFLVCVFTALRRFFPVFFMQTFSGYWAVVCLLLLLFCIRQFYGLIYDSVYTAIG